MSPKVSVVIICKNEEKRIRECLESVKWADEIVICDDFSTDRTLEIARQFTSRIFQRKMDIEGRHRNFAYAQATRDWILSVDADERVTPELAQEIRQVLATNTDFTVFAIPIKAFIHNRWIRYAGYYPARKVRLFKKGMFRYEEAAIHPRIFMEGKSGDLNGDILHYSYRNFADFLTKFNRETTLEAEKWMVDGRKVRFGSIFRKVIDRFFKSYFLKKGYRDGFLGFMMSAFHSLYQLFSYAKYWEMKQAGVKSYSDLESSSRP